MPLTKKNLSHKDLMELDRSLQDYAPSSIYDKSSVLDVLKREIMIFLANNRDKLDFLPEIDIKKIAALRIDYLTIDFLMDVLNRAYPNSKYKIKVHIYSLLNNIDANKVYRDSNLYNKSINVNLEKVLMAYELSKEAVNIANLIDIKLLVKHEKN